MEEFRITKEELDVIASFLVEQKWKEVNPYITMLNKVFERKIEVPTNKTDSTTETKSTKK